MLPASFMTLVDVQRLPRHVAIIMDGNGRWAQQLGLPRTEGHKRGADGVRRVVEASRRLGISALTLYAFSEQNWRRPPGEVAVLMNLLRQFLVSERERLLRHKIKLRTIGKRRRLPGHVIDVLSPIETQSASFSGMTLTLALSYGGQEEIAEVARALARKAEQGKLAAKDIDVDMVNAHMPSAEPGPVDLLIRTGGEQRISNFLLWGSAYAELVFSDKHWPDFDEEALYASIATFQARDRRFGGVDPLRSNKSESLSPSSVPAPTSLLTGECPPHPEAHTHPGDCLMPANEAASKHAIADMMPWLKDAAAL